MSESMNWRNDFTAVVPKKHSQSKKTQVAKSNTLTEIPHDYTGVYNADYDDIIYYAPPSTPEVHQPAPVIIPEAFDGTHWNTNKIDLATIAKNSRAYNEEPIDGYDMNALARLIKSNEHWAKELAKHNSAEQSAFNKTAIEEEIKQLDFIYTLAKQGKTWTAAIPKIIKHKMKAIK